MPKTFAPGERYKRNYDERDIEQAVEAIEKDLSKKQASKDYAGNEVTLEKSKQNEVVLPKVVFEEEAITVNRGLSDFILYPKTPERKGKRNTTERLPFVLTSSGWKQI
ncbi:hypothetical protein ILUMI_12703 [Ignelater luminosus]|uniref:Uncharacterized protein n=1 Tax=Ignelater luminosus TaxID=2038154 RepID=A0A8K0G9B5_IGNLU|nr:hypothetical protein ILUMI_12703 [Ignelater luminosus]